MPIVFASPLPGLTSPLCFQYLIVFTYRFGNALRQRIDRDTLEKILPQPMKGIKRTLKIVLTKTMEHRNHLKSKMG